MRHIILTLLLGLVFWCETLIAGGGSYKNQDKGILSVNGNIISFYSPKFTDTTRIVFVADTHLSIYDERENDFRQYSERMSKAYNHTTHFRTNKTTNPKEAFRATALHAKAIKADLLALGGDIISYPSEAAVEWCTNLLDSVQVAYRYTAGNHDWHYEGMQGSSMKLRDEWIKKRLLPFYKENNPLMYYTDIKGIRTLFIDNSTYEILPEQLKFIKDQIKTGKPLLLFMHIPLYVEGRALGYGVANPRWNASTDNVYKTERREKWPEEGHSTTTYEFRKEIINAKNILGIFTGHVHYQGMDILNHVPQFTVKDNASGAFYEIRLYPMNSKK